MCKFVSGYVTKTGEIYCIPEFTDSHSEIAAAFNLRDTDVAFYAANLAKWECIPPDDTKLWHDFSKWTVYADENETPEWFDLEKIREYAAKTVGLMFVRDARGTLLGGCWIFDGEKATAKAILRGKIVAIINGANLSRANLSGADLSRANLSGADLSRANLSGANLSYVNLSGANLSYVNLFRADLSGADLSYVNLSRADLSGADLSRADLSGANLSGANLSYANLSYANLSYANLSYANLSGADLSRANLSYVNLSRADLSGANLSGAIINQEVNLLDGWKRTNNGIIIKNETK